MSSAVPLHICEHCKSEFTSRSKLFQHLRNSLCTEDAVTCGLEVSLALEKVSLIFGCYLEESNWRSLIWKAIDEARDVGSVPGRESYAARGGAPGAIFASDAHGVELLSQEATSLRVCDVLSFKTEPVPEDSRSDWCNRVNAALPSGIRVLGRSIALCKDFNADAACQRRCYECFVPLSLLAPGLASRMPRQAQTQMQSGYKKQNTTDRSWDAAELAKLKTCMRRLQGEHSFHNFARSAHLGPGDIVSRRRVFRVCLRAELNEGLVVVCIEADALIKGQFRSIVGLLVAVQRGLLPESYIDVALSEQRLVSIPQVPEGTIMLERCTYPNKYHYLLQPMMDSMQAAAWRKEVFGLLAKRAHEGSMETWFDNDLMLEAPQLIAELSRASAGPRGLDTVCSDVPHKYAEVLHLLRKAAASERWPGIGSGREKVIEASTLAEHGGQGGSFTVGTMPGHLGAPAGNRLFPDLARCAFELERLLMPDRQPSSTIAINNRAQFLPHVDSGAGAGQGISLIVGLGHYSGGELVVEGEVHDIRYTPLEFRGWTQRHWTQPFRGERFSLVWFTPCGCENLPGIDRDWYVDQIAPNGKAVDHGSSCFDEVAQTSVLAEAGCRSVVDVGDKMLRLHNGWELPRLALGTFQMKADACQSAVRAALEAGYQLIDTGSMYGNEDAVGEAIKYSDVSRILVLSKCSPKEMSFELARSACEATLRRLGRDVLDIYLIHWPAVAKVAHSSSQHRKARHDTWRAFEELYFAGRVRAIGVSNFTKRHLEQLFEDGVKVVPMVNQIEVHPFFVPADTISFCRSHDIVVQAYAPLGGGPYSNSAKASGNGLDGTQMLLTHPAIIRISGEVERSPAQVLLRWGIQSGLAVVPRSSNAKRIADNAHIFDFALSSEQMALLDSLRSDEGARKFCWDSSTIV